MTIGIVFSSMNFSSGSGARVSRSGRKSLCRSWSGAGGGMQIFVKTLTGKIWNPRRQATPS